MGISLLGWGQLYDAQWALGFGESIVDFRTPDTVKEWFQNNFPQKRATCLEKRTGSEVQCKTKVLGNS